MFDAEVGALRAVTAAAPRLTLYFDVSTVPKFVLPSALVGALIGPVNVDASMVGTTDVEVGVEVLGAALDVQEPFQERKPLPQFNSFSWFVVALVIALLRASCCVE